MTRQRALRLAREWAQGHKCTLRDGEAAEYHSMFAAMLEESMPNEPLTLDDLDVMDYDKVWIDYGDDGEWALVVSGRIYALAVLEGAGFGDILRDEVDGETMDRPSGNYTVYRCPPEAKDNNVPTNEPLTCGLVDRHGMPLRAGDTVAADKFFVYAVRYGSHNVNPDNCAPAYQVGWYLEIMWAYPGFEDSVGHTEPLYDIDGTAARYPAHCADTADGLYNLKLEVCCRPPEGEVDGK